MCLHISFPLHWCQFLGAWLAAAVAAALVHSQNIQWSPRATLDSAAACGNYFREDANPLWVLISTSQQLSLVLNIFVRQGSAFQIALVMSGLRPRVSSPSLWHWSQQPPLFHGLDNVCTPNVTLWKRLSSWYFTHLLPFRSGQRMNWPYVTFTEASWALRSRIMLLR